MLYTLDLKKKKQLEVSKRMEMVAMKTQMKHGVFLNCIVA